MDGRERGGERLVVIQVAFTKSVASPTSTCVSASIGSARRSKPATATLLTRDGNAGQLRRHLCTPVEVTPRNCESERRREWQRLMQETLSDCLLLCWCSARPQTTHNERSTTWTATLIAPNVTQTLQCSPATATQCCRSTVAQSTCGWSAWSLLVQRANRTPHYWFV